MPHLHYDVLLVCEDGLCHICEGMIRKQFGDDYLIFFVNKNLLSEITCRLIVDEREKNDELLGLGVDNIIVDDTLIVNSLLKEYKIT